MTVHSGPARWAKRASTSAQITTRDRDDWDQTMARSMPINSVPLLPLLPSVQIFFVFFLSNNLCCLLCIAWPLVPLFVTKRSIP